MSNAKPTTDSDHAYCMAEVRRHDPDRFLAALFAPEVQRRDLIALYAFNLEVARTREAVSEPMLGEIRLQWWREAVGEIYDGAPRRHAVVQPLAGAVGRGELARADFDRLIDTRARDLRDDPPATLDDLLAYAEGTSATLLRLALGTLGGGDAARKAAGHVGVAWALTGLLRAVPFHARQRRVLLPADLLAAADVRCQALLDMKPPAALAEVIEPIARRAGEELTAARAMARDVPRAALPALLPARLIEPYLRRLERLGWDPFAGPVEIGRLGRLLRLTTGAARGRY